jgi:uncharacterized membrane protein YhaH (DUF805 family)
MPVETEQAPSALALWTGVLSGPIVWFAVLEIKFILVPWTCAADAKWPLYLVSACALALIAASEVLSVRNWRETGRGEPDERHGVIPRSRFLAASGMILSGFFFLVIIAQVVAESILGVCQ